MWWRRSLGGFLLASLLTGCPDPNTYGTPRTIAPGDVQVLAAYSGFVGAANGTAMAVPGLPTLGFRTGVTERIDVGARMVDMTALGGDAKLNFTRGGVDLAVDPLIQASYGLPRATAIPAVGTFQFHVPLLIGINFDEATTLMITPGLVATLATSKAEDVATSVSSDQIAFAASGVGTRLGLGLNIHQSDSFSWQPEVTAWHEFNTTEVWFCVFGIGMNIGAQPDYSDLAP